MADASTTTHTDGYDYSGLPDVKRASQERPVSTGMRAVSLLALVAGGLIVLLAGALVSAVGEHEVALSQAQAPVDALVGDAAPVASTVDLFVANLGDAMQILGGAISAVGLGLIAWLVVRPRRTEALTEAAGDDLPDGRG